MILNVTNISGVAIPLPLGNGQVFNLLAGATQNNLTVADGQLSNYSALRTAGEITFTYVQLPNAAPVNPTTLGRTIIVGTAYTLASSDNGCIVEFDSASAGVLTLPANLTRGFFCKVLRYGSGAVTIALASGAISRIPGSQVGPRAQYSLMDIYCRDNVGGAAAEYVVGGDIA